MLVLSLDTSTAACSAAIVDGDRILAARSEPMLRGHQERLATMVQEMMAEAGVTFSRLERIGVTTGPGSFTGLRVGLAFAKGLALALGIPAVGIGTLEALAASPALAPIPLVPANAGIQMEDHAARSLACNDTEPDAAGSEPYDLSPGIRRDERIEFVGDQVIVACIDARREQVYVQAFRDGAALMAPQALSIADAAQAVSGVTGAAGILVVGSGGALLAERLPRARALPVETVDPAALAWLAAAAEPSPPQPLYLRAPDARLPG